MKQHPSPSGRTSGSARPIVLTSGDPAGIGPDITLQAWSLRAARGLPVFAVVCDPSVLSARATLLGLVVPIAPIATLEDAAGVFQHSLPVLALPNVVSARDTPVVPGRASSDHAAATIGAIDAATKAVQSGSARAMVTNPIAKSVLYAAGFRFPGHTEYLAHLAHQAALTTPLRPVMMLASALLNVVPVTIHIPLADVPGALSASLLRDTILITEAALRTDFGITRPRIAVAGLNPHAGETGTIGREDCDMIAPVVGELKARGLDITGPQSADTMFHAAARTRYDVAIAMYHDQALIPIKTLAFDTGVNVTLGLPFIRTSPDHGTAFEIAGTGAASPSSLIEALLLADRMATSRAAAHDC